MAHAFPSRFPRVPYHAIRHVVGGFHVSTSDAQLRFDMTERALDAGATPEEVREIVRYALAVHADNRTTYRAVMSGRLAFA